VNKGIRSRNNLVSLYKRKRKIILSAINAGLQNLYPHGMAVEDAAKSV
jgi:hypothetical protein